METLFFMTFFSYSLETLETQTESQYFLVILFGCLSTHHSLMLSSSLALRCYLSVLLMSEVIVAGIDANCHSVDWSVHVPLMLHISILGLDHSRPIVHLHCE